MLVMIRKWSIRKSNFHELEKIKQSGTYTKRTYILDFMTVTAFSHHYLVADNIYGTFKSQSVRNVDECLKKEYMSLNNNHIMQSDQKCSLSFELCHEKTGFLPVRKQRRRSASQ